jgi:hypothetical protein
MHTASRWLEDFFKSSRESLWLYSQIAEFFGRVKSAVSFGANAAANSIAAFNYTEISKRQAFDRFSDALAMIRSRHLRMLFHAPRDLTRWALRRPPWSFTRLSCEHMGPRFLLGKPSTTVNPFAELSTLLSWRFMNCARRSDLS